MINEIQTLSTSNNFEKIKNITFELEKNILEKYSLDELQKIIDYFYFVINHCWKYKIG